MSGWGGMFGKIADQFQGRIERLKNERIRLQKDLDALQRQACTDDSALKASKINDRIKEIDEILKTKASD